MTADERHIFSDHGWTSTIYAGGDIELGRVVKDITKPYGQGLFDNEREVYERLWENGEGHPNILRYFGTDAVSPKGLVLECAESGCLRSYIYRTSGAEKKDTSIHRKWASQTASALAFLHQKGIIHADVYASNLLLTRDFDIKVCDMGAASIDDRPSLLTYRATHQLWVQNDQQKWRKAISVASDIFALGCVLYELETGQDPFEDLDHETERDELVRRLRAREMPDTSVCLVLGETIQKCWSLEYHSMNDIVADLNP